MHVLRLAEPSLIFLTITIYSQWNISKWKVNFLSKYIKKKRERNDSIYHLSEISLRMGQN